MYVFGRGMNGLILHNADRNFSPTDLIFALGLFILGTVNEVLFVCFKPKPVAIAPVGSTGMTDADGEIKAARAAEKFRVTFKDLDGQVLNQQEFITLSGSVDGGVTVSFSGAGIHRVEVLGLVYASGGGVDDLTFTSAVPEPATWASMVSLIALWPPVVGCTLSAKNQVVASPTRGVSRMVL